MACPACTRTRYRLIVRECPICAGKGLLRLGTPALALYPPETVAAAATMALEVIARRIADNTDLSADRKRILNAELSKLHSAGILHLDSPPPSSTQPLPKSLKASELAELAAGEQLTLFDIRVCSPDVEPYEYKVADRPRARGLPVLSASGHPSAVAMICDPADPLGDTATDVHLNQQTLRRARVLREAAHSAANLRSQRGADVA